MTIFKCFQQVFAAYIGLLTSLSCYELKYVVEARHFLAFQDSRVFLKIKLQIPGYVTGLVNHLFVFLTGGIACFM